jgi:hypothetical protein
MKARLFAVLTIIAALMSHGSARAQITTVILADNDQKTFTVSAGDVPKATPELKFTIGPVPFPGAGVTKWALRVVPTTREGNLKRASQDVIVLSDHKQVGYWSAYDKTTEPYARELLPEAFEPGSDNVVKLTLKTESKLTSWDYHGGMATDAADRPRLIVTYDSDSASTPTYERSGQSTDWKYAEPSHFFSAVLWSGEALLANPVSYAGAVYVVARSPGGRSLSRVTGGQKGTSWPVRFNTTEKSIAIGDKSFAFVTAWGRLHIITKEAIGSRDLTNLGSPGTPVDFDVTAAKITVNERETPAMGPDGSLYFKNVDDGGAVVAFNPARKEIWRTKHKFTNISPIALNANGSYAYALADFPSTFRNKSKEIALVRIDTATGETVAEEVKYKDGDKEVFPDLEDLLRPAVASKGNVDYVFVAGNTSNTGILQLMAFQPGKQPIVLWSRLGKVQSSPVLSVVDGNSLFAIQGGLIKHYPWYDDSKGAFVGSDMEEKVIQSSTSHVRSTVLVDGANSLYVLASDVAPGGAQKFFFYPYDIAREWKEVSQPFDSSPNLLFARGGALIGYDGSKVYDLSPKAVDLAKTVKNLDNKTIYSADSVTVAPDAAKELKNGDQVILKGHDIKLPKSFKWSRGKTLKLQTVPKGM